MEKNGLLVDMGDGVAKLAKGRRALVLKTPFRAWGFQTGSMDVKPTPVRIYPNPVHDILTVEHAENLHLSVYSVAGQKIYEKRYLPEKTDLFVGDQYPGAYLVKLKSETGLEETGSIIIKE